MKLKQAFFQGSKNLEIEIMTMEELMSLEGRIGHSLFEPHVLNFYQIMYLESGNPAHEIDFKVYPVEQGSIVFLSKGQAHRFIGSPNAKGFIVFFTEDFLQTSESAFGLYDLLRDKVFDYHLYDPVIPFSEIQSEDLKPLFSMLYKEYQSSKSCCEEEIILHYVLLIMAKAARMRRENLPVDNKSNQSNLRIYLDFRKLVEEHYTQTRNVKDYAEMLGVSGKKLNIATKDVAGENAKSFIDKRVILEIKRQLTKEELSIKEVAFTSGFDDPTNMVKYFKQRTQVTPAAYRKSIMI